MYVYIYTWMDISVCARVLRPDANISCLPRLLSTLYNESGSLTSA